MEDKDETRDDKGHTPRIIVGEKRNTNARYELNDFDLVLDFCIQLSVKLIFLTSQKMYIFPT